MLISDPTMRVKRNENKRRCLLRFLRDETWAVTAVLGQVAGLETRQAANKTLLCMERDSLVKKHTFPLAGYNPITVWGITPHGLALSWDDEEKFETRPHFQPSRVGISQLQHQLCLQQVRLETEKAGWGEWMRGERLGFKIRIRPDAIAVRPTDGLRVAFEVELTVKTRKRYQASIREHLMLIRQGAWDGVVYLSQHASRLQRIFDSIEYVPFRGEHLPLDETHRKRFRILALDSLETWLDKHRVSANPENH